MVAGADPPPAGARMVLGSQPRRKAVWPAEAGRRERKVLITSLRRLAGRLHGSHRHQMQQRAPDGCNEQAHRDGAVRSSQYGPQKHPRRPLSPEPRATGRDEQPCVPAGQEETRSPAGRRGGGGRRPAGVRDWLSAHRVGACRPSWAELRVLALQSPATDSVCAAIFPAPDRPCMQPGAKVAFGGC